MFTLRPGVMSLRLLPFMRSLLSPKAGGGDVASDVTQAYRFPAARVAALRCHRDEPPWLRLPAREILIHLLRHPGRARVTGALSSLWEGGQPPPIEGQEPLPMALCRQLVIAPALRKGKPVMHARIQLDLPGHASLGEDISQFLDHRQRRERVMFST